MNSPLRRRYPVGVGSVGALTEAIALLWRGERVPPGGREPADHASAVLEAAVLGAPDDDLGEVPKAVIQPMEMPVGDEAAAALGRELIDYWRAGLASVKCPRTVDFRGELPRDETGKLYKRLLRDEYWQGQDRRI